MKRHGVPIGARPRAQDGASGRSGAAGAAVRAGAKTASGEGHAARSRASDDVRGGMAAGTVVTLEVAREVPPNGFFLTDGNRSVLLHYSEAEQGLAPGDRVEGFLYHDSEDRLAATMKRPLIRLGEVALLEVVDVEPRLGCFLEIGLSRHLLMPVSELPESPDLRPVAGDRVYAVPAHDRQGRLIAKAATEKELAPLSFRAPDSWKNRWLEATVYRPLKMGAFVICDGGVLGFGAIGLIPAAERTRPLRLGERVRVRVTFVREDGRVNLSMRERKEVGRVEDAERLLAFLKERPNGAMPYSDETPADIIAKRFRISKAAFKRALGKLMKDGLVYQEGNWTYLRRSEDEEGKGGGF